MSENSRASGTLARSTYLAYGTGMIGERLFRDAPALLLLLFLTDHLAVPAALAGIVIFFPKIWVICLDPLVGILSDRLRTRWGRRRPLMLVGALLTPVSFVLMFNVPAYESSTTRALYVGGAMALGFTAYSFYSVPYLAMGTELSRESVVRTRLMSVRIAFMSLGLIVSANAGTAVELLGGGLAGYRAMGLAFGLLCLVTMLVPLLISDREERGAPVVTPILSGVRQAFADQKFRLLFAVGFTQKMAEGVGYGSMAYFFIYWLNQPLSLVGATVTGTVVGLIVSQPLWLALARRVPRSTLYGVAVLGYACVALSWLWVPTGISWIPILLGFLSGIFGAAIFLMTLALLADVAGDGADSIQGAYTGVWLAGEKFAFALGALAVGLVLSAFGFAESSGSVAAQSPSALRGIAISYVGLHLACYAVSFAFVLAYARIAGDTPIGTSPNERITA